MRIPFACSKAPLRSCSRLYMGPEIRATCSLRSDISPSRSGAVGSFAVSLYGTPNVRPDAIGGLHEASNRMLDVLPGEGAIPVPQQFDDLLVPGQIAGPGAGTLPALEYSHEYEGEEWIQQTPQSLDEDRISGGVRETDMEFQVAFDEGFHVS